MCQSRAVLEHVHHGFHIGSDKIGEVKVIVGKFGAVAEHIAHVSGFGSVQVFPADNGVEVDAVAEPFGSALGSGIVEHGSEHHTGDVGGMVLGVGRTGWKSSTCIIRPSWEMLARVELVFRTLSDAFVAIVIESKGAVLIYRIGLSILVG